MQKQSAYVRELYIVIEAVNKFRNYLFGHQFTIKTDQETWGHLYQQTIHTQEQQCWLPKLLRYNFNIEYKLGKENIDVDALSRCFIMHLSMLQCPLQCQTQQLRQ